MWGACLARGRRRARLRREAGPGGAQVWPEGRTGVEVRVEGFSQKLGLLTQTIFSRLASLHTQARRSSPFHYIDFNDLAVRASTPADETRGGCSLSACVTSDPEAHVGRVP